MTIIVLLILAGVSLNAIIGDNGIINNAMDAKMKNGIAVLEEFLQEEYVGLYDVETNKNNLSKVEVLLNDSKCKKYFYIPQEDGIGNLNYVVNKDGKILYLLKKSGLPKEIQEAMTGGSDEGKEYNDYQNLNDVYGVTSDLRVYYSSGEGAKLLALSEIELDKEDLSRDVFSDTVGKEYKDELIKLGKDANGDGVISAEETQSVKELIIGEDSSINSLDGFYNFVTLEKLIIENKHLTNLEGIQNCPVLRYIFFNGSAVDDYSAMNGLGSRLKTLYFYNIYDGEFLNACNGIKEAKFTNLEKLAVVGDYTYIYPENRSKLETQNETVSGKCSKTISTLEPLSILSNETKQAVKYLSINNNNLKDEDLTSISGFTNLYLLRVEYNSFTDSTTKVKYGLKTLDGLENMKKLTYLYASNNLLGTDCDEEEGKKNCLTSLKDKNKKNSGSSNGEGLYYVNLRDNENLKYVDDLINNTDIKYLYLSGCNKSMNVNQIASIIKGCGSNYDLPCKFLDGEKYVWTEYYSLNGGNGKDKLTAIDLSQDLKNNEFITALDLHGCKSNEITNDVLNEILKTMLQLKYLRLDSTNLETLDFCKIDSENGHNYAYCPNLIEIDLRDTYVTDISNLNNLIKENSLYPDGRNLGTLRLNDSLSKNEDGSSKLVNLNQIQDVINGLTGECSLLPGGNNGLCITSFNTMKLLEGCTSLERIRSNQYNMPCRCNGEKGFLNLSSLNDLSYLMCGGWYIRIGLKGNFSELNADQCCLFEFLGETKISGLFVINTGWPDGSNLNTENDWRKFFKSFQNYCTVNEFKLWRCKSFNTSYLIDETEDGYRFDGSKIKKFTVQGLSKTDDGFDSITSLNGFEVLTGLKILNLVTLNHLTDFSALSQLTNLTGLYLDDVSFKDTDNISVFATLSKLETVYIKNAIKLTDLNIFSTLSNLTELKLINCGITSCVPFKDMVKLTKLDLQNNSIGVMSTYNGENFFNLDILENLHNSKGGALKELYLTGNSGLAGTINSHNILKLKWSNSKVW